MNGRLNPSLGSGMPVRMTRQAIQCSQCTLGVACPDHRCVFTRVTHPPGHVLFHQGAIPEAAHFLRRGLVLLTEVDSEGRVSRQALRPAGSLLEPQVVRGTAHRFTAAAVSEVDVCSLPVASRSAWLGPAASPARALLELCLQEAARASSEEARTRTSATARVAAFLLTHAGDGEAPLELQHQLVAGLLSLRPETLSRVLTRLRDARVISTGRQLRVLDRAKLSALADEADEAEL